MELIVIKYMQLVCISFLMQNNADCAELTTQGEERNNLKLAACSADCLETAPNLNLTQCYQQCASQTESLADITAVEQSLNASFQLFCRDSKRLLIGVESDDVGHVENEKFIYLLVIRETQNTFGDHSALIADEPLIELRDLKSSESYNISVTIISSRYGAQYLGTRVFTTLREGYKPENVTEVRVEKYQAIEGDGENVTVTIGWEPARDHTCYYQLIAHGMGSAGDFHIEKGEEQDTKLNGNLHYHMLTWKYGETYAVAVRGVSFNDLEDEVIKSAPVWIVFDAPDCFEFHNDSENVCGPRKVEGLKSTYRLDDDDTFDINFTWTKPDHPPDSYTIEIRDFFVELVGNKSDGLYVFNVNGTATSFLARGIRLKGERSRVNVTAYRNGQEEAAVNDDDLSGFKRTKPRSRLIDVLFYTFVTFTAVFLVVLFRVWQNRLSRIVTTLTQKQLDGMDLDLIKSITNHSMLEAIADLTRDTTMEVERESIELMEALGEGAFGLVKKAIVIRNGTKQQVAVKMLKNSANFDDIKQFHQEISVMKSVGTHPNVVSIIGHCTSNIEELMLLTEFCDAGSLLDLLRLEFTRQLNFYDKQRKMARGASAAPAKYPDNLHNFDGDGGKETSSYKNFGGASQLFVVNKMYDDLNNNNNNNSFNGENETHQRHQAALKAIELTATNALYFELSENDSKPVIVEMAEPENPRNFLASANLISFARQVSDGMDFLARKKVVHRDLAARNILVCSDKTAKIADFGLSRDIYQDNIYRKIGNGKLPIKWLAVESMTHQVYTSQSDVWSFGILLYEIVMLGATPYPSIGPEQLLKILNTGYRMEKPRHCHDALYDLMMSCWHANPTDRPSFEELSSKLNHFLLAENSWDERHVDLPALFDKCTSEMNYMKPIA